MRNSLLAPGMQIQKDLHYEARGANILQQLKVLLKRQSETRLNTNVTSSIKIPTCYRGKTHRCSRSRYRAIKNTKD